MSGEARSFERYSSPQAATQSSDALCEPNTPDPPSPVAESAGVARDGITPRAGVGDCEIANNDDRFRGEARGERGSAAWGDDDHTTHSHAPPSDDEAIGVVDAADAAGDDDNGHHDYDMDTDAEESHESLDGGNGDAEGAEEAEEAEEEDEDGPAFSLSDEFNHTDDEDDDEDEDEEEEDAENERGSYLDLRHDRYTEVRDPRRVYFFRKMQSQKRHGLSDFF